MDGIRIRFSPAFHAPRALHYWCSLGSIGASSRRRLRSFGSSRAMPRCLQAELARLTNNAAAWTCWRAAAALDGSGQRRRSLTPSRRQHAELAELREQSSSRIGLAT